LTAKFITAKKDFSLMLHYAPGLSKKIMHKIPFLFFKDYTRLHQTKQCNGNGTMYTTCVRYNKSRDGQGGKRSRNRRYATTPFLFMVIDGMPYLCWKTSLQ